MEQMKVGIIGAGRIAANMAKTLDGMDDAAAYAVAARNLDRAQKFAKEWGFEKAKERLIDPKLAGGALLDVGIYPLNFASMVLGDDVEETLSFCVKFDSGVDAQNSIILKYKNGSMASIQSSALTGTEQYGMIYGTKGYLIAENINDITAVKVYTPDREFVREITMPEQITGFEYEVRASMKAIREGKLECTEMPHEESIRIMEQMDGLRKDWGIEYPFEKGNRPC